MKKKLNQEISQHSLIVGPDDGTEPVFTFVQQARHKIRLKQFKLIEPNMIQALADAVARGVDVRVILNEKRSGGDRVNDETREQLEQVRDLLRQLLDGQALFRCSRCGFRIPEPRSKR